MEPLIGSRRDIAPPIGSMWALMTIPVVKQVDPRIVDRMRDATQRPTSLLEISELMNLRMKERCESFDREILERTGFRSNGRPRITIFRYLGENRE